MASDGKSYSPLKWNEDDLEKLKDYFSECATYLQEYLDPSDKTIIDFGAGSMYLKRFLSEGVTYYPVDIVKRSEDTIVCDLNKGEFPNKKADVAILSGILEYLEDTHLFLDRVSLIVNKVIVIYNGKDRNKDAEYSPWGIIRQFHDRRYIITDWNLDVPENIPMVACFERASSQALVKNALCTGCGTCVNICPSKALSISEDEYGFLKPKLDIKSCTKCDTCITVCPTLRPSYNNRPVSTCYAVWAPDDVRNASTSGGAFTMFANEIIGRKGTVFGAAWKKDFSAEIKGIKKKEEIHELRRSKYVQCNVGDSFQKVEKSLESKSPVLYIGCPCQIAGLKKYLGAQYPNLYLIDVICSHVSPQKSLKKYLNETFPIDKIAAISFWGGSQEDDHSHVVRMKDGTIHYRNMENDAYEKAFFGDPGVMMNDVCRLCQFCIFPRQGDISIGDFEDIGEVDESWNDGKGTSLVTVNNSKGEELFNSIRDKLKRSAEFPRTVLSKTNNRIGSTPPKPRYGIEFLKLIDNMPFEKALSCVSRKGYDVGIAGMYNRNYGNNMTYYALYQFLKDEGKTVLMVDCPEDALYRKQFVERTFPMFMRQPYERYEVSEPHPNKKSLVALNDVCDSFILGSDHSVTPSVLKHHGDYGYFSWVRSNKRKIAYSVSFLDDKLDCSEYQKAEMEFYFKRFDDFSVREKSGIELIQRELELDSEWAMDPVFLCDEEHYKKLSEVGKGNIPRDSFLGAYMKLPEPWKVDVIKYIMEKRKTKSMNIIPDGHSEVKDHLLEVKENAKTEEWVANILHSDFFVTDSFYGVCFSLIFRKQFVAVFENRRDSRVNTLLEMVGLDKHIIGSLDELKSRSVVFDPIDYDRVHEILGREIEKSKDWLRLALSKEKKRTLTEYDLMINAILSSNEETNDS